MPKKVQMDGRLHVRSDTLPELLKTLDRAIKMKELAEDRCLRAEAHEERYYLLQEIAVLEQAKELLRVNAAWIERVRKGVLKECTTTHTRENMLNSNGGGTASTGV